MKCIQCGTDNRLRDRRDNGYRCKQCQHAFVFEPTTMGNVKLTDALFAKAIADLSANNTLYFTPKQLFYILDRRLKRKKPMGLFSFLFFYFILGALARGFLGNLLSPLLGRAAIPFVLVGYNMVWIFSLFRLSNAPQFDRETRRRIANQLLALGVLISVAGGVRGIMLNSPLTYGIAILLGLPALWLGYFQKRRSGSIPDIPSIDAAQMQRWIHDWVQANGAMTKLLSSPTATLSPTSQPLTPAPDLTAYSFDRLVVCQSDAIAQMLISNHFHFENNCAVLGISGYPQSIFDVAMQMVRRNPDLKVFAFHDCSPAGVALVEQLRTDSRWFPDSNVVIVDVGLLPRQVLATKRGMMVQKSVSFTRVASALNPSVRQNLSPAELQWLESGKFVELESFTPQQLIRILHRSIALGQESEFLDSSSALVVGGGTFYAIESFG